MDLSNAALQEIFNRLSAGASPELLARLAALLTEEQAAPSPEAPVLFSLAYQRLSALPLELVCAGRVAALVRISVYYYVAAKPEAGLGPAADAVAVARQLKDSLWLCKTLKMRGVLLADTGNIPDAIGAYAEALTFAREANDRVQECGIWINIGIAHQYSAHFSDAVGCYERAVELAGDELELQDSKRQALGNIANAALQLGDSRKGILSVMQAIQADSEPSTSSEQLLRVHYEHYFTRLLLESGLTEQAKERTLLAKRFADESRSGRAQILASIAEGLTEIHCGQHDVGFTRLKRALEKARSDVRAMLRETLAALIKGYEVAGQPDAALVYLREIKRLHQDGREAQVLMHHAQHLARVDRRLDEDASAVLEERQSSLRGQLADRDLMRTRIAMLERQSVAAELHDDTTGEHCYRVGRLSSILAAEYGVDEHTCFLIDLAARMHDIGKLAVPDGILLKPGKFTPEERAIMETHTTAGADLLAKSNIPQMYVAEEIARHHHERYDGTGYPTRLKGPMIPLAARITALADVYDALTHVRPYKQAWSVDDALREISSLRGKHFDPELTDLFLALVPRLQRQHGDLDAFLGADAKHSPFIRARRQLAEALKKDVNEVFEARR
jgi:putative two-component system response regulator